MSKTKASNNLTSVGLERNSILPMYVQIAKAIEAQVASGVLRPGDCLESENKLCKRLAISRVTARLAIDELVKMNLVERRQGKGTYVAHRSIRHDSQSLDRILDALFAQGHNPSSQVLAFGIAKPPREVAAAFKVPGSGKLIQLERLYLIDGRPVGMAQGWLTSQARIITLAQAEAHSTAHILANILRLKLGKTELVIRADTSGRAVAKQLNIPARAPALVLLRKRFLADGRAAEVVRVTMNPRFYEFHATASEQAANRPALQIRAA